MRLGAVLILSAVAFALVGCRSTAPPRTADPAPAPPPPIEATLPLVGDPHAVDAFGYPTAWVDRVALQRMLREHRFAELTAALEAAQSAFEQDWRKEYWAHDAVEAFTADPKFEPDFAAWVAASPASFAPLAARGAWLCDLGLDARGSKSAAQTRDAQWEQMHAYHARGVTDLREALARRPKLVAASRVLITLGTRSSREVRDLDVVLRDALVHCPNCLHVRVAHIINLEPRWGGSWEEMDAFARAAMDGTQNQRLAVLAGYSRIDQADDERDAQKRRRLLDEAIAIGEASDFYRERAVMRSGQRDSAGAVADLRRAVQLRPAVGLMHAALAVQLLKERQVKEANDEMQLALALDGAGSPVLGYARTFLTELRKRANEVDAARELLEVLATFETDEARRADVRRRLDGRTTWLATVPEPVAWTTALPPPAELFALLDDPTQRDAAWCRLLERAIGRAAQRRTFNHARCEVDRVERAAGSNGASLRMVLMRPSPSSPAPRGGWPFFVVGADGDLASPQPGMRQLGADDVLFTVLGERKAYASVMLLPAGKRHRTTTLSVALIDDKYLPPLWLALGGPALVDGEPPSPMTWRVLGGTAERGAAIEVLDARGKVRGTYRFDAKTNAFVGPPGSKKLGFRRLDNEANVEGVSPFERWNVAHEPCAAARVDRPECAPPAPAAP